MGPRVLPWTPDLCLEGAGPGSVLLFAGFGAGTEPLRGLATRLHDDGHRVLVAALGRHTGDAALFHRSRTWHYYFEAVKAFRRFAAESPGPIVLGGYSTGALIALLLASRAPDRVAGLVLVSPLLRTARRRTQLLGWSFGSLYYVGLPLALLGTVLALAVRSRKAAWGSPRLGARALATAGIFGAAAMGLRTVTVPLRSGGPMEADGELVVPPHFERASLLTGSTLAPLQLAARHRLPGLGRPVCAVFGSADDVVDVAYGVERVGEVEGAEVHVIDGAPHRVVATRACHDIVSAFAGRVSGTAPR